MPTIIRCRCKTNKNLVCKKKGIFEIQDKLYCSIHANKLFKFNIIKIQKVYRGYKIRKLLNKIYYNLPLDLQRKILFHVRENHLLKNYYKVIDKIIVNKLNNLFNYNVIFDIGNLYQNISSYEDILFNMLFDDSNSNRKNLVIILYLFNKYNLVIKDSYNLRFIQNICKFYYSCINELLVNIENINDENVNDENVYYKNLKNFYENYILPIITSLRTNIPIRLNEMK